MFTPRELELERGWPGHIEGDRVVQLAAQTLQSFFTGGGLAREHAEYALDDVLLRAPVLHPPSVRVFEGDDFTFANPAAIHGPDDVVRLPEGVDEIVPVLRLAAIIGADGEIGGHTLMNHWRAPALSGQKSRDFAISLGPIVLAPPQDSINYADWAKLLVHAARNTKLVPGDVIAAGAEPMEPVGAGDLVELGLPPFGTLRSTVAA
jgi:2-keto-4-pentenoate hydratase/2-oxohepta-3-ene-1,7-dioic acid hydratase in catechol pathway